MSGLTSEQVRQFDEEGYLLLRKLLPAGALTAVQEEFERVVSEEANRYFAEGLIADKAENLPFATRYARIREQTPPDYSEAWRRKLISRAIYDMWQLPELVDVLRPLLGGELHAHSAWNGRPRPPKQPISAIGWHQDAAYYRQYKHGDGRVVSVWLPLVPVDERAGCLQVLPRSTHAGMLPIVPMGVGLVGVSDNVIADFTPLSCIMAPGDVLLFDQYTVHRALDNIGDTVRWSLDIRFYDARCYRLVANDDVGFYCHSDDAPSRVESLKQWSAKYDDLGEY